MPEETVTYRRSDIVEIFKNLNVIVVSLDRLGSASYDVKNEEEYNAMTEQFLTDYDVSRKLSDARAILGDAFSRVAGDDGMDELERECQGSKYWSLSER